MSAEPCPPVPNLNLNQTPTPTPASAHGAVARPPGTPTAAVPAAVAVAREGSGAGAVGGSASTVVAPPSPRARVAAAPRPVPPARPPAWRAASAPARWGPADPVRALLHQHRELCERAVDPLEVAVGLEAAGITDRTVGRFRHRDVFSLAEEMYARVAHADDTGTASMAGRTPAVWSEAGPGARLCARWERAWSGIARIAAAYSARLRTLWAYAGWFVVALLPGAAGVLLLAGLRLSTGGVRLAVGSGGILAATAASCLVLRYGPLRARRRTGIATRAWTCVLLGYALVGDGLLRAALADGGPGVVRTLRRMLSALRAPSDGGTGTPWAPSAAHGAGASSPWPAGAAPDTDPIQPFMHAPAQVTVLVLAFAAVPAACCARLFVAGARRRLARSRCLTEFTATMRPLLFAALALFLWSLTALLTLAASVVHQDTGYVGVGALGVLLMLARLLAVHGRTRAPALLLGAAGATEALTLGVVCAAHLPGCGRPAAALEAAVGAVGPGAVPGVVCGAAALALLTYATHALTRASAHPPSSHLVPARPPSGHPAS